MNKTDDILEKLKNVEKPQIDMTEEIMNTPLLTSPRGGKGASRTLFLVRTVLSLAAMWIVGFFVYLKYEATVPSKANNTFPFGGGRVEACTLKEVYKYRFCQDCKKTISYTQIRSMLYEKK